MKKVNEQKFGEQMNKIRKKYNKIFVKIKIKTDTKNQRIIFG